MKRKGKSKQKKRVLANGDKMWFDESTTVPQDFKPRFTGLATIHTPESEWLRDTVQSYFKRAEHGIKD